MMSARLLAIAIMLLSSCTGDQKKVFQSPLDYLHYGMGQRFSYGDTLTMNWKDLSMVFPGSIGLYQGKPAKGGNIKWESDEFASTSKVYLHPDGMSILARVSDYAKDSAALAYMLSHLNLPCSFSQSMHPDFIFCSESEEGDNEEIHLLYRSRFHLSLSLSQKDSISARKIIDQFNWEPLTHRYAN